MFHCELQHDTQKLNEELTRFKPVPNISEVTTQQEMDNFFQVTLDIQALIDQEVYRLKMEWEEIDEI